MATSKQFRERVSQAQRREEVDALLHAGRHPNLVRALVEGIYFEFWEQSLEDRRYFSIKIL